MPPCPKRMQETLKAVTVVTMATGIHGTGSTCTVSRLAASYPYSEVITKKEYDMGYANHIFVLIIITEGTMDAKPILTEKMGV